MSPRLHKRQKKQGLPGYVLVAAVIGGGLLLIFAALSLIGGGTRAAIEVTGQPRLKVDREGVDLGDVPLGQAVRTAFVLTNVGDRPLRLTDPPYVEVVEGC
jgi:anaerobic glycerol-3-phosphate dehydrogenase